jgi:hypothetical protein
MPSRGNTALTLILGNNQLHRFTETVAWVKADFWIGTVG